MNLPRPSKSSAGDEAVKEELTPEKLQAALFEAIFNIEAHLEHLAFLAEKTALKQGIIRLDETEYQEQ